MDKKPDLMETYEQMLRMVGMECTKDGFVRMLCGPDEYLNVLGKDGNVVVLPIGERLRDPKAANYEIFHLLSDNAKTNDADLFTRYRHWMINRFNITIGGMGDIVLRIVADKALRKKLRPDQAGFLELVEEADLRIIEDFEKMSELAGTPNQVKNVFMSLYVRAAQVLEGKSYSRVASVSFPFYDELVTLEEELAEVKKAPKGKVVTKVEREVFGVPIRIKDQAIYKGLMHYLIPNLEIKHVYDLGTNSRIAPSLDALMRAFLPLAAHLNAIGELLTGLDARFDERIKDMYFDLDWADAFHNLDVLWDQIRMVPQANYGVIDEPAPASATKTSAPAKPAPPWNVPAPAPVMGYAAPAPTLANDGAVSVAAMMNQNRRMQPQQYVQPQQSMGPQRIPPHLRTGQGGNPYGNTGYGAPNQGSGYPAPIIQPVNTRSRY